MERATAATIAVERAKEVKAVKDEDVVAKGTVAKGGMVDMAVDMAKIQPLQLKVIKENRKAINGLLIKGKAKQVVTAKMQRRLVAPLK